MLNLFPLSLTAGINFIQYCLTDSIISQVAETIEESDFTGAFERVGALRSSMATEPDADLEFAEPSTENVDEALSGTDRTNQHAAAGTDSTLEFERTNRRLSWLSPIELNPRGDLIDKDELGHRTSNKGFLPISLTKYLEIAD